MEKLILLDFVKSILEFMKKNPTCFNSEKLDIMCNMIDYINNYVSDEEATMINRQIQAIKNTLNLESEDFGYGDNFNEEFNKKDLMSLATIYLMALSKDKKIYTVDDSFIYYIINSLRGIEYKHYSNLLKGLLYQRLLDGIKLIQETEPLNIDRIRITFNTLIDSKTIENDMTEEEFEKIMQDYLEKRSIPINPLHKK